MTPLLPLLSLPLLLLLLLSSVTQGAPRNASAAFSLKPDRHSIIHFLLTSRLQATGIAYHLLSRICSTIHEEKIFMSHVEPAVTEMKFVLHVDACHKELVLLTQPHELWGSSGFTLDRPTVIFITGWRTIINEENSEPLAKAFACRNDSNFTVLDAGHLLTTLYNWAALNTDTIGRYLALALFQLPTDYATQRVHLIGHSLGAQIAGSTGRYFKQFTDGSLLPRVTGVDPANPCFYEGKFIPGLKAGDAQYVDIIHSNPTELGTAGQTGDADFFVEGLKPNKEGCTDRFLGSPTPCSHQRALDYLVESSYPNNTANFRGRICQRYDSLRSCNGCSSSKTAIMGLGANSHGLFYVDVNAKEPYGKEASGESFTSASSTCGVCDLYPA